MKSATRIRRNQCTAFGHKFERCHRDNHFETMCRSRDTPNDRRPSQTERFNKGNAVFNSLFNTKHGSSDDKVRNKNSNHRGRQQVSIPLDHHVYDSLSNTWIKQNSKPQPFINPTVEALPGDHKTLGIELVARSTAVSMPAMADTGCQICLAGLRVIHPLGLRESDLIPVTINMHTATDSSIRILGAILLRLSSRDPCGQLIEMRQMTYITPSSDKLFLSREACMDLGIITNDFPTLHATYNYSVASIDGTDKSSCGRLVRQPPPPASTTLSFAATDKNHEKLQQFLLDFYGASTFNMCKQQTLPMMDCPPLKLMVNPDAEPVAHHTPVPVPIHWRDDVKKGLDHDVKLGVIELVPFGEPITWCHRMVICAKKNGQPRHTVDLQALNTHTTRETHHTPSPFLQAWSVPPGKKKTVFDAWNGYHSVPLCEEDRHLTTFITPWGRYRYRTAPLMDTRSENDEIVADIPNKTKCIDDALLWPTIWKIVSFRP